MSEDQKEEKKEITKITKITKICRFTNENCPFLKKPSGCKFSLHTMSTIETQKNKNKKQNHKKKNTESFIPSHKHSDMKIKHVSLSSSTSSTHPTYPYPYQSRDVFIVHNLFSDLPNIYEQLLYEMKESGVEEKGVWKSWHGDTHLIADDHIRGWKTKEISPLFYTIIERLQNYFKIDIKATRFNWYPDTNSWKPQHHDAAAVDKEKAKIQNVTIGVSFGDTREAQFEHAVTKTTVGIDMEDGMVYGFCKDLNIEWRHGIPQINPEQYRKKGRISIIVWGWVDQS